MNQIKSSSSPDKGNMQDSCNAYSLNFLVSRDMDGSMKKVDLMSSKDQILKDQISLKKKNA